jgi:hypothetical protein
MVKTLLVMLSFAISIGAAKAQCVEVKYHGDPPQEHARYPYCSIPPKAVDALIKAGSVGRQYIAANGVEAYGHKTPAQRRNYRLGS